MQSSHAHIRRLAVYRFFLFTDTPTTAIYTLSLHDALPILLEHDAKIAVLDRFREAGEGFRCRVPIHVAERDDILALQVLQIGGAASAGADDSEVQLAAGR